MRLIFKDRADHCLQNLARTGFDKSVYSVTIHAADHVHKTYRCGDLQA